MSFSSSVKNELSRMDINDSCCILSELSAVYNIGGVIMTTESGRKYIKLVTENAAFARRVFSLVKKQFNMYPEIATRKSRKLKRHISYTILLALGKQEPILQFNKKKLCCKKAYLRGAFLSGGSVSDPEKTYHLEITARTKELAEELEKIMNSFNLNSKVIKRKNCYIVYLKEGENIVDFLNIIGAHSALLKLENVRILKEMRNNVNRIVNCETANLEKTVNASFRQVENIKYIKEKVGFEKLPRGLREIAELRLEYSDASLKELGEMLNPTLGKSGVNHRLRKLDKIAETEREVRGD